MEKPEEKINEEKWHERFLQARWQESGLSQSGCFAWLRDWTSTPTHTIARVMELYKQPTPTKVYTVHKTGTTQGNVICSLCRKSPKTLAHVYANRPAWVLCFGRLTLHMAAEPAVKTAVRKVLLHWWSVVCFISPCLQVFVFLNATRTDGNCPMFTSKRKQWLIEMKEVSSRSPQELNFVNYIFSLEDLTKSV